MDLWRNKYRMECFAFEDRKALIVFPEKRDAQGRWALKTEYFAAFQELEEALVERGFHLLYLENRNRWGTNDDLDAKERFMRAMAEKYALAPKGVLVGMSCGGLCSVNFAAKYPSLTSVLYLDAPVMNLLSCPMGFGEGEALGGGSGWAEIQAALGFRDIAELLVYRDHPMDRLEPIAEARIPVALVYGEADVTVPYRENGIVLERLYRERGLPLFTAGKPGCGHHPHGLENPKPLADFIEAWAD